jgi:hypothetical protein
MILAVSRQQLLSGNKTDVRCLMFNVLMFDVRCLMFNV